MQLLSDLLGAFDETFEWELNGTSQLVKLQFKGRVGGPIYMVGTLRQPALAPTASCSAVRCLVSGAASQARKSAQLSTRLRLHPASYCCTAGSTCLRGQKHAFISVDLLIKAACIERDLPGCIVTGSLLPAASRPPPGSQEPSSPELPLFLPADRHPGVGLWYCVSGLPLHA